MALGAVHGALDQQRRGLKWAFWRRDDDAAAAAPSEPPVDTAVVEQIVALAGPDSMDAATWAMIHSGVWLHTWAAQGLLQSVHDATHMPWLLVIPMSVAVTRSALLPVLVYTQRVTHAMGEAKPKMDAAQLKFRAEMERGVPMQEAQVRCCKQPNQHAGLLAITFASSPSPGLACLRRRCELSHAWLALDCGNRATAACDCDCACGARQIAEAQTQCLWSHCV